MAGARQGTKTAETLKLWSRLLGVDGDVYFQIDLPSDARKDLLAATDIFVSIADNLQETFGLSVVEAMAAGCPVVVSDFNGYKDTVDASVGIRVKTSWFGAPALTRNVNMLGYERPMHLMLGQSVIVDHDALLAALLSLVCDDALRCKMGKAAADRAASTYDWQVVLEQMVDVWCQLATCPAPEQGHEPEHEGDKGPAVPSRIWMDHSEVFSHYITQTLDPVFQPEAYTLTPLGHLVQSGTLPFHPHPVLEAAFDFALPGKILNTVMKATASSGPPLQTVRKKLRRPLMIPSQH